jgi:hypothetical protein
MITISEFLFSEWRRVLRHIVGILPGLLLLFLARGHIDGFPLNNTATLMCRHFECFNNTPVPKMVSMRKIYVNCWPDGYPASPP